MAEQWHDVNDPGFYRRDNGQQQTQQAQPEDEAQETQSSDPEVRLSEGTFVIPTGGPEFNKKCAVSAKVEYLRETQRKKITFSLFSTYNGSTQDMRSTADGFEKDGVAKAELTLYYNDAYYDALESNPNATVDYFFKATHPKGQAELQSENLTMPYSGKQLVLRLEVADQAAKQALDNDTFTLYSTDARKSYSKQIAVKDAVQAQGSTTAWELTFSALSQDYSYSLEVAIGDDKATFTLLDNVSLDRMAQAA